MLSVIILSVFMLNLTENPIMLSAVTLNVVMLSVVAPFKITNLLPNGILYVS
jgi:hypothetical protein